MGKQAHRQAVEDHLDELGLHAIDPEDEALLAHIFEDDRLPQGLHRQGFKGLTTSMKSVSVAGMRYFRVYNGCLILDTIAAKNIEAAEHRANEMFDCMWDRIDEV